jgi:hypothetical protein
MEKDIKYIGFYDVPNSKTKRVSSLAATNKMDYICEAINKTGYKIHLISPSWIVDKGFSTQKTIQLSENKKITYCPSIGSENKIKNYNSIIISLLWLFFWLLKHVKKDEKIIVYHSPWIALPLVLAKKIKGFKLILEVEEVYGDVSSLHPRFDVLEKKIFQCADSFLFSTDLLAEKLNNNKPFVIIYGNYTVPEKLANPTNDGKIHLLYAGIIDSHKAGAFNAIETALFLNENYMMHIIGFGEIEKLQDRIQEINKTSQCKVFYEGIKQGEEYIRFCQSCHIGLSTQNTEGAYTDTSFPSKILSYLGMGLNVISGDIKCVSSSSICSLVNYYNGTPRDIAEAIITIDLKSSEYIKAQIQKLDNQFLKSINKLINK